MDQEEIQHLDDELIMNDVARAVEERELVAYYQPVYDLRGGSLVEVEALVRWTLPDGTLIPAALFVPSLDRMGVTAGLDWFMAEEGSARSAFPWRSTSRRCMPTTPRSSRP